MGGNKMSISDIRNNIDNLHERDKDELVRHIHELLIHEKRQDSKIVGMKTEIRYLNRHLKKIRDLIDKTLKTKMKDDSLWCKK
jgi:hypothetical protein